MTVSVNTNQSALMALQNLNATTSNLNETQNKISTGLKVNDAKDNAAVWAIAQKQRANLSSYQAVTDSLNRASSISDVASSAGSTISDLLNQIQQKVVAAMDPSYDTASRNALNTDYKALLKQITQTIQNANFNGANLLDGSITGGLKFLANADGTTFITVQTQNLSLGGAIITMPSTSSISTVTLATAALAQVKASIGNTNSALATLGTQQKQVDAHNTFVSKLQDTITTGIGNLVDADMASESAKLQALQVQQQLGAQALSIANQAPQIVLSLFKG
jgi:flagellin